MSTLTNGGSAFPSPGVVLDDVAGKRQQGAYEGMTLRDYFAAKAMHALVEGFLSGGDAVIKSDDEWLARRSYEIARAMLTIRELGI